MKLNHARTRTDDTGRYRVQARLVKILLGKVRLQKDNGWFTTVPLERLSPADRQYLRGFGQNTASARVRPVGGDGDDSATKDQSCDITIKSRVGTFSMKTVSGYDS